MKLKDALEKKDLDVDYIMSILSLYEQDEYVKPNNSNNHFTVFQQLFEMNLVVRNVVPVWRDGALIGSEITFLFNLDLDYSFALI